MKKTIIATIAVAAILQGCVTAETKPAQNYVTTNLSIDTAKERLITRFAEQGGFCEESKNTMKCDYPISTGHDILIRALVSGGDSGSSKNTYAFTFVKNGKVTNVYVKHWITAVTAYGAQINSSGAPSTADINAVQSILIGAKS